MSCWVSDMSLLARLSVFLHYELECLDCPLELQHAGGTIISSIQF
jgi:hypothetical protein